MSKTVVIKRVSFGIGSYLNERYRQRTSVGLDGIELTRKAAAVYSKLISIHSLSQHEASSGRESATPAMMLSPAERCSSWLRSARRSDRGSAPSEERVPYGPGLLLGQLQSSYLFRRIVRA